MSIVQQGELIQWQTQCFWSRSVYDVWLVGLRTDGPATSPPELFETAASERPLSGVGTAIPNPQRKKRLPLGALVFNDSCEC